MKAVVLRRFGKPEQLELSEVNDPRPGDLDVLIRVKATGINPVDTKVRAGTSGLCGRITLPEIIGWDVSGIVEGAGIGVLGLKPTDEVFGCIAFPDPGRTYAEYTLADAADLALKPPNVTFQEAAAVPLAGLTAYQAIHEHLKLQQGQHILIQGGAGGVGHLAVQFAALQQARVSATASAGNAAFLQSLGADQVIDYRKENFEQQVESLDAVLDTQGGEVLYRSISCMRPGGRVVCLPSSTRDDPKAKDLAEKGQVELIWPMMHTDGSQMKLIAELLESRKLHVYVERIFALEQMAQAHEAVESGHTRGKIVVDVA
jgi:NADPH:quinone reductase-like Zn-dependent oxidoreductase